MRKLLDSDLLQLRQILVATEAFTPTEIECAMELLETVLNDPTQQDYQVIVAEHEGVVAGYVLYGPVPLTEGNFDLYWIATDPELHGKGIGRQLMKETERRLRVAGARLLCLETSSQGNYSRTRKFYEQAGYLEESRIRDFYRLGDDRITYVKRFRH
ncbi:MAG: GNAT family N-acetyltransferase [Desulfuromonadales bacterium]|nr:GNAT family N-acetyltransferase [Desulfuromonadales bacterium]